MQRKPGFPGSNCNIKMPDSVIATDSTACEEDGDQQQRRQQLINFGHTQWGFNNWSWSVTKQDLDFVDFASGKYSAGVVAFVSVQVKNLDIHRENIGYATSVAAFKGSAIHQARKSAVTNALRETLLSFGGDVATELQELLEATRNESPGQAASDAPATHDNNQHLPSRPAEPKRAVVPNKGDPPDTTVHVIRPLHAIPPAARSAAPAQPSPALPVAAAHPMRVDAVRAPPPPAAAASRPPAPPPVPAAAPPAPAPPLRPNSNGGEQSGAGGGAGAGCSEEARAERRRRQRQAQEEFRLKQLMKQRISPDDKRELHRNSSTFDKLLLDIPTQDIVIEYTGNTADGEAGKRAAPQDGAAKRRNSNVSKLDIVQAE